jgi:hypothetical protein
MCSESEPLRISPTAMRILTLNSYLFFNMKICYLCDTRSYPLQRSVLYSVVRISTTNSVALVRKRTIPTERPPHVGEVSANFCG